MKDNVYFVSGIDTNIGKSYAIWRGSGTKQASAPLRKSLYRRVMKTYRKTSRCTAG